MVEQERDVVTPPAQWRQVERDYVQAEIQVVAEQSAGHRLLQVDIGGGDDAHVHAVGARAAQPLELPLLEDAQQLGLQGQGQLADLVEEDGAAVRLFEAAHPGHHRAGEGAFLVTEQFALQQVFRQGGAVHLDERPVAP